MSEEWRETRHARQRIRPEGVAEIRHHDDVQHTLELAREQVTLFAEMLDGKRAPLLVVVGSGFRQDGEARRYLLGHDEVGRAFSCGAMLLSGRAERVTVNVFLRVTKTIIPMKAFNDERRALAWLTS